MTAPLPRGVGFGVMRLDGRGLRVATLQDGRRILVDLPVIGMLDGAPEEKLDEVRVRFLAEDGKEWVGYEASLIVMVAKAIGANDPADCEGEERRIALECRAFAMLCAQRGRRAMGVEGKGVLS
jgi:hypothetical protein